MTDTGMSDYFIFEDTSATADDGVPLVSPNAARVSDDLIAGADQSPLPASPPVAPVAPASVVAPAAAPAPVAAVPPSLVVPAGTVEPQPEPPQQAPPQPTPPEPEPAPVPAAAAPQPVAADTRAERLHAALDDLIAGSPDVEAAAVISLDGFTMASALPAAMQEDRVGAMSAAILALGERASRELGKGKLTQVFIEGEGGYVMLMAAGTSAVLTCMASEDAKLGLVIYDMRKAAARVGTIVG